MFNNTFSTYMYMFVLTSFKPIKIFLQNKSDSCL